MPRLWIVSELYAPEETSTGLLLTRIAESLVAERSVHVVCAQPGYTRRVSRAPRHEVLNGVDVYRVRATRFHKDGLVGRTVNMITFLVSTFFRLLFQVRRGEVVLGVTNPPLLPYVVAFVCWLRGCRFLFLLHDVLPEILVASGLFRARHPIVRMLDAANRRMYRRAIRVVCLGRDMRDVAAAKRGTADGVVIIPNWGDTDLVRPMPRAGHPLLSRLGLDDRFVVLYLGNLGRTHGVETVVEAVRRLQARRNGPAVHLLAVGIGAQAGWLTRLADGEGAHWLTIRGPCSDAELGEYLTACDASVIALKPGMKGVSVPSRMYNAMAAGRPVLAVADEDSELAMVIQEEEAGWVAPPHDPQALAALIERMIEDPTERARRGAQGRAAVLRSYTLEASLRQWDALLHSIDSASSGSAAGA